MSCVKGKARVIPKTYPRSVHGRPPHSVRWRVLGPSLLSRLHVRRYFQSVRFPRATIPTALPRCCSPCCILFILGLGRIETTELLRRNGVFRALTGLPAYPDPTPLRPFLLRFGLRGLPTMPVTGSKPSACWRSGRDVEQATCDSPCLERTRRSSASPRASGPSAR